MSFKQKFYFKNGRTLEIIVQEELKIRQFNGVLEIVGDTNVLINLNEVELVEITKQEVVTNGTNKM